MIKYLIIKNQDESIIVRRHGYTISNEQTIIKEVTAYDISEWRTNKKPIVNNSVVKCTPMSIINYFEKNGYNTAIDNYVNVYCHCNTYENNTVYFDKGSCNGDVFELVEPQDYPGNFCVENYSAIFNIMPPWPNTIYGQLFNYTQDNLVTYWDENLGKKFTLKPGRFLTQFGYDLNWCEIFTEGVKALNIEVEFKEVRGLDIIKYYNEKKYYNNQGDLGSSCMRYENTQAKLGFYAAMSDISLLVAMTNGKVVGRTILWNSLKFMDRIYTNYSYIQKHFLKWAHDNGYTTKAKQSRNADDAPVLNYHIKILDCYDIYSIKNLFSDHNTMPYMDSFKWWSIDNVTNQVYLWTRNRSDRNGKLENTNQASISLNNNRWLNPNLIINFKPLLEKAKALYKPGMLVQHIGRIYKLQNEPIKVLDNKYIFMGDVCLYDSTTNTWTKRNVSEQLTLF